MAEYIEREAFRAYWNKEFRHRHPDEVYLVALASFPAADVVEVVRCKDCKHCDMCFPCKGFGLEAQPVYVCRVGHRNGEVLPNDFCSCGAKMDGKGESE